MSDRVPLVDVHTPCGLLAVEQSSGICWHSSPNRVSKKWQSLVRRNTVAIYQPHLTVYRILVLSIVPSRCREGVVGFLKMPSQTEMKFLF